VRLVSPTGGRASIYVFDGLFADLQAILDRSTTLKARGSLDKRIPARYLRASVETRLAVLQGLMDTDGTISKSGSCELGLSKHDLALDALELIRSLGIKATITERKNATYAHDGVKKTGATHYRIKFTTTMPVFRLPRKSEHLPAELRETQGLLYVTDITVSEPEPMRCLKVAHHEHLYLTGGFVPTHNSVATQAIVFNALARGWQLALINTVDKATDFIWAKPFVKDHMWGCDSRAQSVTVAKLVVEHGEKMGALLSEHSVSKWQDLPESVRDDNPPLLLVADELAALLVAPKLPAGLPKEVKALPEFVQMTQDLLEANLLMTTLSKIPAVYRAAGIRVEYLTQQPNERYGFSTSLKGNLPHRVMLGVNPSPAEKGHAFRTPEKVPDVPKNIATDSGLSRGVGLAHLDGQEPAVIKGYFAPLESYLAEAKRRGFPTTLNPEPTARMIERMVPRVDDDGGFDDDEKGGYGRGERKLEDWEIDPNTGKPLDGRQRANMAKAKLARDAREAARDD
jgi:replicative DNA helicase